MSVGKTWMKQAWEWGCISSLRCWMDVWGGWACTPGIQGRYLSWRDGRGKGVAKRLKLSDRWGGKPESSASCGRLWRRLHNVPLPNRWQPEIWGKNSGMPLARKRAREGEVAPSTKLGYGRIYKFLLGIQEVALTWEPVALACGDTKVEGKEIPEQAHDAEHLWDLRIAAPWNPHLWNENSVDNDLNLEFNMTKTY